jgi:hypothetical protein
MRLMNTAHVVRAIPVRGDDGSVQGWVRADLLADGSSPTDQVFLRDGTACGQAEALERLASDSRLLFSTRGEAVRDGIARLRKASAKASGARKHLGGSAPRTGATASDPDLLSRSRDKIS